MAEKNYMEVGKPHAGIDMGLGDLHVMQQEKRQVQGMWNVTSLVGKELELV